MVSGTRIIPPYDNLEEHVMGNGKSVFVITYGDLVGTLDEKGRTLIPLNYSKIAPLEEGSTYETVATYRDLNGVAE